MPENFDCCREMNVQKWQSTARVSNSRFSDRTFFRNLARYQTGIIMSGTPLTRTGPDIFPRSGRISDRTNGNETSTRHDRNINISQGRGVIIEFQVYTNFIIEEFSEFFLITCLCRTLLTPTFNVIPIFGTQIT